MIPDDAAGRPLSPTELATIADLERRLLDAPGSASVLGGGPRRRLHRPANVVPLAALLGAGVVLMIAGVLVGGLPGAAAVAVSVVAAAFTWPLLPPRLGGPVRPRPHRRLRSTRPGGVR